MQGHPRAGSTTSARVPCPNSLFRSIVPPCASTIEWQMLSPSLAPPPARARGAVGAVEALDDVRQVLRRDAADTGTSIARLYHSITFHALEHSHLELGDGGVYGTHSVVHGGPTPWSDTTITGENGTIGGWAVVFRSRIGDESSVGYKSLVQQSELPADTVIPDHTVIINDEVFGKVEW
jgi:hypothetical protein